MNKYFERAVELKDSMVQTRRDLHQIPELGLSLPKTKAYIKEKLEGLGLEVKEYGESGLGALIEGNGPGKTILLRADMDALPMAEENNLDFAAQGEVAHTCGHDLHASMLLAASQIIVENRDKFPGNVKLMFQPAEEIFKGAPMMIEEGILENPPVDAALAVHTALDDLPGSAYYTTGSISTSCDNFKIDIQGKGGHGAYPHTGIDPIFAAVTIYNNFSQLISRENPPQETTTLTFGQLSAGASSNIIPDKAVLQGTMRTYSPEIREKFKIRMKEIVDGVAMSTGCKIVLDFFSGTPSVHNDEKLAGQIIPIIERDLPDFTLIPDQRIMASEDMGYVSEKVPTLYIMLNCKVEGNNVSHHNPGVLFNEDAMPYGAGYFATAAIGWLNESK